MTNALTSRDRASVFQVGLVLLLIVGPSSQAAAEFVGIYGKPSIAEHGPLLQDHTWIAEDVSGYEMDLYILVGENVQSVGAGTVCKAGATGNETCGFQVSLQVSGDMTLDSFNPDGAHIQHHIGTDPAIININGVNTGDDPRDPLMRLGKLIVSTTSGTAPGALKVTGGEHVKADLTLNHIAEDQVIVKAPEPAGVLMLMAGILLLVVLSSRRRV